jgi:hypothetical protein
MTIIPSQGITRTSTKSQITSGTAGWDYALCSMVPSQYPCRETAGFPPVWKTPMAASFPGRPMAADGCRQSVFDQDLGLVIRLINPSCKGSIGTLH